MHAFDVSVRTAAAIMLAMVLPVCAAADDKSGTVKITATGPDGKPAESAETGSVDVGFLDEPTRDPDYKPTVKGRVVFVYANGPAANGQKVIYLPVGKETPVTVQMQRIRNFENAEADAASAKKSGDTEDQQRYYDQAKMATERIERLADEAQTAIDNWARDNGIPVTNLSGVEKQLKLSEKLGSETAENSVSNLKSYRTKLVALERLRNLAADYRKRLAAIAPPPKKVSLVPGACPEGQSGGLLAGLLNQATGTNSFAGICDDKERQKDNKDRDIDRHEPEHKE